MNAKRGGFDASDTWRNNISGSGALIKKGTGSLTLEGANSYKGGTFIKDGTIIAANKDALGSGNLKLSDGTLKLSTKAVSVKGNYTQGKRAQSGLMVIVELLPKGLAVLVVN